jgi:hypothetical protein
LAFRMARLSPVAAYQTTVMDLAETDVDLKMRFEDAARAFRSDFLSFTRKKEAESGGASAVAITVGHGAAGGAAVSLKRPRQAAALDLAEVPRFEAPVRAAVIPLVTSAPSLGWLAICGLVAFAGAFARFRNYDVR